MGKKDKRKVKAQIVNTAIKQTKDTRSFFNSTNRKLQKLVLFIVSILIYSATINFDYTLDDTLMITENNFTKEGYAGIKDIMTNDALAGFLGKGKNLLPGGRYRPLSHVLFAIEYELIGLKKLDKIENPNEQQKELKESREKIMKITGHSLNVILYALLALLIFTVLLRLFKQYEKPQWYASLSFIATLLFVVHPLHTEITCNIKNVDELMSMTGSMAVIYFLFKYYDTRKLLYLIIPSIIYILAILSKEDSLTFLAVIPLTFYVFTKANLKEHIKLISPLIAGLLIYFIIRYNALGFMLSNEVVNNELLNNPFLNTGFGEKLATVMLTWGIYLKLLFIPYPLTHDYYPYHIEIVNFSNPFALISTLIWVSLIVYALLNLKKKSILSFGILFFLITFSISSNLIVNIGAFMNERFVFIPLLGFTIVIAYLIIEKLSQIVNKKNYPTSIVSTLIIIVSLIFSVQTFSRSFTWKDDYTLFTTDVKTSKNSAKCNVSAGGMIYHKALNENDITIRNEMFKQAINYLETGIKIYPNYIAGLLELGNVYLDSKMYSESKKSYERVLKINSKHPNALNNMLALAQRTTVDSNYSYSNVVYQTLLKYEPQKSDYLYSMAINMTELNRIDTAKIILEDIINNTPSYYKAYYKLGEIYGKYLNDITYSEKYLKEAYKLNPEDPSILENLGIVYGIKGEYSLSLEFFNKALTYSPEDARIFSNIAGTYYKMNQLDKAKEYLSKAEEARKTVK